MLYKLTYFAGIRIFTYSEMHWVSPFQDLEERCYLCNLILTQEPEMVSFLLVKALFIVFYCLFMWILKTQFLLTIDVSICYIHSFSSNRQPESSEKECSFWEWNAMVCALSIIFIILHNIDSSSFNVFQWWNTEVSCDGTIYSIWFLVVITFTFNSLLYYRRLIILH